MSQNDERAFFVDDELVERLMRGDSPAAKPKTHRHAETSALANAIKLAAAGRLDDAVKELEGAAARGEKPAEIYSGLGHLRFEQQKWGEAAACYSKVIAADANNAVAHYNLGLALERQGQFDQAGRSFETALSLNPALWQAHTGRGLCLLHLGQAEQALPHFDQALKSSPGQDRTLFGKAVALHQLGKFDEAVEIY